VVAAASLFGSPGIIAVPAQQLDSSSVIQHIDAAVKARVESIAGYTVTEYYAVYRGKDATHPVAERTVKTAYRKDMGKSYTILSQSGSEIIQSLILDSILDHEKNINEPGNVEGSWLTSANYEMKLEPGGIQKINGRDCIVIGLIPRRKAPNMIKGTMWVDAKDYSIIQIQGVASKSLSLFVGPTQMMRQYSNQDGFAEATHARAAASSLLFGQTIVTIDYSDYRIQLVPHK
jgi:outer membrane lipoprotein-sorting protein